MHTETDTNECSNNNPIPLSPYTLEGIARMYGITRSDVISVSHNLQWVRRAVFRLRDWERCGGGGGGNDTNGFKMAYERENTLMLAYERDEPLLGLIFVPE